MGFLDKLFSRPAVEGPSKRELRESNEKRLKALDEQIKALRPYDREFLRGMGQRSGSWGVKAMLVVFGMGNILRGVGYDAEERKPIEKVISTTVSETEVEKIAVDTPVSIEKEVVVSGASGWANKFTNPGQPNLDHTAIEKAILDAVPSGVSIKGVEIEAEGYASPEGDNTLLTAEHRTEQVGSIADQVAIDGVSVNVTRKADGNTIRWTDNTTGSIVEGKKQDFLLAHGLSDKSFEDIAHKVNRGKLSKSEQQDPVVKAVQDMLRQSRVEIAKIKISGVEHKIFERDNVVTDKSTKDRKIPGDLITTKHHRVREHGIMPDKFPEIDPWLYGQYPPDPIIDERGIKIGAKDPTAPLPKIPKPDPLKIKRVPPTIVSAKIVGKAKDRVKNTHESFTKNHPSPQGNRYGHRKQAGGRV